MLLDHGKVVKILDKARFWKDRQARRTALVTNPIHLVGAVEKCQSGRADPFWIAIATTIYRQSNLALGYNLPFNVFAGVEMSGDWWTQVVFQLTCETLRCETTHTYCGGPLTYQKSAPVIKGELETTPARFGGLTMEYSTFGDEGETKRRLFRFCGTPSANGCINIFTEPLINSRTSFTAFWSRKSLV